MRALGVAMVLISMACASRTKTPVSGNVAVSGTCGMESGGEADDRRDYGLSLAQGADHSSVTLKIDSGKLATVSLEVVDIALTPQASESAPDSVTSTSRGSASPGVQLVVGEWVTVDVPLRQVERAESFDVPLDGGAPRGSAAGVVALRVRILGDSAEFAIGQSTPSKGPCAWGRSGD